MGKHHVTPETGSLSDETPINIDMTLGADTVTAEEFAAEEFLLESDNTPPDIPTPDQPGYRDRAAVVAEIRAKLHAYGAEIEADVRYLLDELV